MIWILEDTTEDWTIDGHDRTYRSRKTIRRQYRQALTAPAGIDRSGRHWLCKNPIETKKYCPGLCKIKYPCVNILYWTVQKRSKTATSTVIFPEMRDSFREINGSRDAINELLLHRAVELNREPTFGNQYQGQYKSDNPFIWHILIRKQRHKSYITRTDDKYYKKQDQEDI